MSRIRTRSPSVLMMMLTCFCFILLLFSPGIVRVAVATRTISDLKPGNYATFKPKTSHDQQHEFRSGSGVNDCLPKGFHRTSAPSRYINYHTFGSTMCSTSKHASSPWKYELVQSRFMSLRYIYIDVIAYVCI